MSIASERNNRRIQVTFSVNETSLEMESDTTIVSSYGYNPRRKKRNNKPRFTLEPSEFNQIDFEFAI
jgi:hypothetical protein